MAPWSAENATKAYLQALKLGKRGKEPSALEFLAALAAGNNSQLMVMACSGSSGSTALALVCASRQTGGRAVCILRSLEDLAASRKALGRYANCVDFAIGDAWKLLSSDYGSADFVLIDCKLDDDKERVVFPVGQSGGRGGLVVVGYNALHGGGRWWRSGLGARFLPIGEGLLVGRISGIDHEKKKKGWVFEVDEFTGEEHFYRITSPYTNK
ncbi:hypothetical protein Pfo_005786 [Paulownia fortunei]|nr:hypothetical protein Pfo_005786 [Paulownia fortunei]